MDLALASIGMVLLSPLMLVMFVLVRATSPGPALFRQVRVGANRRTFVMLKFRTMRIDADQQLHLDYVRRLMAGEVEAVDGLYKLDHDPRITRLGALLRRTSLDELPQLLNVLRGDMSVVGPRPMLPAELEMLPPWAGVRFEVPPGITGLWQVSGRNRLTMTQGLRIDVDYTQRRSAWLDLLVLLRTIPAVLGSTGR
ncbi:sugar transferase [Kribbella sp. NPDC059898]|uniref:sugar transferase n=1 Tax=Kribbella sp. NPDC059898 TaxID=3346995 RepID=UPI00366014DC